MKLKAYFGIKRTVGCVLVLFSSKLLQSLLLKGILYLFVEHLTTSRFTGNHTGNDQVHQIAKGVVTQRMG